MARQIVWQGEEARGITLARPCFCGCDNRDGKLGVGYLTGSNGEGKGFSIWIESEEVYERVAQVLVTLPSTLTEKKETP